MINILIQYCLISVTVLPEYRRKGYGKKVLLDTIHYCKKLNKYNYFRVDTTYYTFFNFIEYLEI